MEVIHFQVSFPSCAFLTISDAEKMRESKIPATVKVPPIIAHTCKTEKESLNVTNMGRGFQLEGILHPVKQQEDTIFVSLFN